MSYNPQNPNGSATSANSAPVVIASDQAAVAISAAALPLPTGAATSANQATEITSLATIATNSAHLTDASQKTQLVDGSGNVIASTSNALNVDVTNFPATQAISASALPLPTGAATSALQTTGNTALTTINTTLGTPMQNSGGSVTANAGTNLNTSALATSANLTAGTMKTQLVDGSGNVVGPMLLTVTGGENCIPVGIAATNFVLSSVNTSTAQLGAGATFTGTIESVYYQQSLSLDITCDQPLTVIIHQYIDLAGTYALPTITYTLAANQGLMVSFPINGNYLKITAQNTGASTTTLFNLNTAYGSIPSSNSLGNTQTSLSDVGGTPISIGQQVAAASLPVVLPAAQVSALATSANQTSVIGTVGAGTAATNSQLAGAVYYSTPPTLTNTQQAALQADSSGNLKVNIAAGSSSGAVAQGSTTSGQTGSLIQGAVTTSSPSYSTAQTNPLSLTLAGALRVDGSAVTQPVSMASAPTGAATSANQTSTIGTLAAGTSATNSMITGGVYTSALQNSPTASLTNGQQIGGQLDQYTNQLMVLPDLMFTGQSAQTATINNIIPATASATATTASNYRSGTCQVNSTGTAGGYIFEMSNDNSNWVTMPVYNSLLLTGVSVTAAVVPSATNIIYTFPITSNYIRLRISTLVTGGSIQAFTRLSQAAWSPFAQLVSNTTAANLACTATIASGTVTTVSTVTAVTGITNALPAGTNNIGLVGTGGSTGVANAPVYTQYSTPVTTAAYTQLIASTTSATNKVSIFDSSGQAMILATGASGSEVILAYVPPGGADINVQIPASTRIALKALTANAASGYQLLNLWK